MIAAGTNHTATIFAAETFAAKRCTRLRGLNGIKRGKAFEVNRLKSGPAPCHEIDETA